MKKRIVLMALIALIAIIATGAVFAQAPTMDKLAFSANQRNNPTGYWVAAANKWISGQVVIPGTYNGLPVVGIVGASMINNAGFSNCANITSVVILDGVTTIGNNAFYGCTSLASVTIPNSVTVIDRGAFRECSSLTSVVIPAGVTNLENNIFNEGCTNLTSVTIQGIVSFTRGISSFPGDLREKYQTASGGPGTYTRQRGSDVWTKGAGVELCPTCGQPLPAGFVLR